MQGVGDLSRDWSAGGRRTRAAMRRKGHAEVYEYGTFHVFNWQERGSC